MKIKLTITDKYGDIISTEEFDLVPGTSFEIRDDMVFVSRLGRPGLVFEKRTTDTIKIIS